MLSFFGQFVYGFNQANYLVCVLLESQDPNKKQTLQKKKKNGLIHFYLMQF